MINSLCVVILSVGVYGEFFHLPFPPIVLYWVFKVVLEICKSCFKEKENVTGIFDARGLLTSGVYVNSSVSIWNSLGASIIFNLIGQIVLASVDLFSLCRKVKEVVEGLINGFGFNERASSSRTAKIGDVKRVKTIQLLTVFFHKVIVGTNVVPKRNFKDFVTGVADCLLMKVYVGEIARLSEDRGFYPTGNKQFLKEVAILNKNMEYKRQIKQQIVLLKEKLKKVLKCKNSSKWFERIRIDSLPVHTFVGNPMFYVIGSTQIERALIYDYNRLNMRNSYSTTTKLYKLYLTVATRSDYIEDFDKWVLSSKFVHNTEFEKCFGVEFDHKRLLLVLESEIERYVSVDEHTLLLLQRGAFRALTDSGNKFLDALGVRQAYLEKFKDFKE